MTALKLTRIGNSVGVILPKEVLARLKLEKGDTVFLTDAANGVNLSPCAPTLEEQFRADATLTMRNVAAGTIDEAALAAWLRRHTAARGWGPPGGGPSGDLGKQ